MTGLQYLKQNLKFVDVQLWFCSCLFGTFCYQIVKLHIPMILQTLCHYRPVNWCVCPSRPGSEQRQLISSRSPGPFLRLPSLSLPLVPNLDGVLYYIVNNFFNDF